MFCKPHLIIFLCLVWYSNSLSAQKKLILQIDSVKLLSTSRERVAKLSLLLSRQDTIYASKELAELYHELGKQYYREKKYNRAIFFTKKAVVVREKYKNNNLELLNKSRYNLALFYRIIGKRNEYIRELKEICKDNGIDKKTVGAYTRLANYYANKGDYHKAFQYLNSFLSNKKHVENTQHELEIRFTIISIYAKMYNTISNVENENQDIEIVKLHQKEIERKIKEVSYSKHQKEDNLHRMYNNLAIVYDAYNNFNKALYLYNRAYNYYLDKENIFNAMHVATNIGVIYSKQKRYRLANFFYQKVIKESSDNELIAAVYDNQGFYLKEASALQKIPYFQKAIQTVLSSNSTSLKEPFKLPSLNQIKGLHTEQDMLTYLTDLSYQYVQAYKEENKKEYLIKARESLNLIDKLVSIIRYESASEQSKLFWIDRGVNLYMLAVEVCYLLNKPDEAFYFMEKNKALLLQENIKTLQAKLELKIPKSILEREYKLHYKEMELGEQLQRNPNDKNIRDLYAITNNEYKHFMDSLTIQYANYVKIKKEVHVVTLQHTIKKQITANTCFVEYILYKKDGYGLFCNEKETLFFKIKSVPQLQNEIAQLKKYVTKPVLTLQKIEKFKTIGHAVFKKLFPFKNALSKVSSKKMIIVSDYTLQSIPFEILPVAMEKNLSESYLVNYTEISYVQSFSVAQQIAQKENHPAYKILAVAPCEFMVDNLPTLYESEKLIKQLLEFKLSKSLLKSTATKNNFLKNVYNYQIIHLNTHAGLDSVTKEPWIAFRENKMSLKEMYGIENQASLVVLDACKTSDGTLALGEGVINLSRGFFYNGSQSVLASLWNVNEQSGNSILKSFYKNLQRGETKSKALQLAKINYLKNNDKVKILPYYWGAFTLTGSSDAIILETNTYNIVFIFVGIVFLLLIFNFVKKTYT